MTPGLGNWLFSHLVAKSLPDAAVAAIVQVHLPLHEMLTAGGTKRCVCMYVCVHAVGVSPQPDLAAQTGFAAVEGRVSPRADPPHRAGSVTPSYI